MSRVSLLFPAYNRLEFTKASWAALLQNTNWAEVSEFHVYDDGSTDGTREWLREQSHGLYLGDNLLMPSKHLSDFHSPMGVTLDWIKRSHSPILAKLDNDTIYPPGWLDVALGVMDRHAELDFLGLECMREPTPVRVNPHVHNGRVIGAEYETGGVRFDYLPAVFVSGLGLYRRRAFEACGLPQDGGYFGLEEWQQAHPQLRAGWILPSLPTILLDRLPMEPWRSLSEEYVRQGWQRKWSLDLRYKPEQFKIWEWWTK